MQDSFRQSLQTRSFKGPIGSAESKQPSLNTSIEHSQPKVTMTPIAAQAFSAWD